MKLIFTLLMIPVYLAAPAVALMTASVYWYVSGGSRPDSETFFHILLCALHLCVGLGLIGGIVLSVYCAAMCLAGFVIKSWYRAVLAGGISFGMGYCVWYLNSVTLP